MTIKELYEWAIENHVEDFEISVCQKDGCYSTYIEPYIRYSYCEVEL